MIQYVLIDLDDTLLDFKRGEIEAVVKLLKEYQVPDIDKGLATYIKINQATWQAIENGEDRETLLNQRFAKTMAQFGIQVDGTALNLRYLDMISNNFYLIPNAKPLLDRLNTMGVKVIAATNGIKRNQIKRLKGANIIDQFTDLWISEDVGIAKPDPAFFDRLFAKHPDMNHDNTVMIGDGLNSDIKGANLAHLKSVWYLSHANVFPKQVQPDWIVTDLNQIPDLLTRW